MASDGMQATHGPLGVSYSALAVVAAVGILSFLWWSYTRTLPQRFLEEPEDTTKTDQPDLLLKKTRESQQEQLEAAALEAKEKSREKHLEALDLKSQALSAFKDTGSGLWPPTEPNQAEGGVDAGGSSDSRISQPAEASRVAGAGDAWRREREEQDLQFQESLKADRAKEEEKREEEGRREEEEKKRAEVEARKAEEKERKRQLQRSLPPEPDDSQRKTASQRGSKRVSGDLIMEEERQKGQLEEEERKDTHCVEVAVRLPNSVMCKRRWLESSTIGQLYDWVDSCDEWEREGAQVSFTLSLVYPRTLLLRESWENKTLLEAGFDSRMLLAVETLC